MLRILREKIISRWTWHILKYLSVFACVISPDLPTANGVPPLTPGTTQKMSHVIAASFRPFHDEQKRRNIPRGETLILSALALLKHEWLSCFIDLYLLYRTSFSLVRLCCLKLQCTIYNFIFNTSSLRYLSQIINIRPVCSAGGNNLGQIGRA